MSRHTFYAQGLTCGHCAAAVRSELEDLGLAVVDIDVVKGGTTTITIDADEVSAEQVAGALEEAGGYVLVPGRSLL